jgi:quercetin dioxygenase-like cupin family protein
MKYQLTITCIIAVLLLATAGAKAQTAISDNVSPGPLYQKGKRAPSTNFTGTVWVQGLASAADKLDCVAGVVSFEAGARTNWHRHPGGQLLMITEGSGYYQEEGRPRQVLKKGDVVKCPSNVNHWHGASEKSRMVHIAIATNAEKGNAVWLQPVTSAEYAGGK